MKESSKSIDEYIGNQIRRRRVKLGLSQAELAKIVGVSAQQVQRYEAGENTVAVDKLLYIANALNTKPSFFIESVPVHQEANDEMIETVTRGLSRDLSVLLIEDDPNDVILFNKAVDHKEHKVDLMHLSRPEEVMPYLTNYHNKYGKSCPDIIILDINLPRINGIEILKNIKSSDFKRIPVVMLTNSIRKKDMIACYELQASGFIQKSTELATYYDDIDRIISFWSEVALVPTMQS